MTLALLSPLRRQPALPVTPEDIAAIRAWPPAEAALPPSTDALMLTRGMLRACIPPTYGRGIVRIA